MASERRSVAIVGAGVAGLTAALAFDEAGFSVDVYERAPKLEVIGAGLQLSPNALRVLKRLSVARRLEFSGVKAAAVTLRGGHSGRAIARVPVDSKDGTAYVSILRADLQAALLGALADRPRIRLFLDHELTDIVATEDGARLFFAGPEGRMSREADITIAADGVRSRIAAVLGHPAAIPSGDLAWRMTLPRLGQAEMTGIEAWLGRRRHAVAYPIAAGGAINLVLIGPERDAASSFGGAPEALRQRLLTLFKGWDTRLLAMVAAAGPIQAWPLLEVTRHRRASDPRGLIFVGDAAHAMRPYAAQGAGMAIEDGLVAAFAFARTDDRAQAACDFEELRCARVARVRKRVAFHDFVYHLPQPFALGRNAALALRSQKALRADLAWLYDWTPPEI